VRYLPGDADFAMKSGQRRTVSHQVIRQEFEGDRLRQLQVIGPIDLTHSAFAEQPDNPVATREHHPRNKSGVVD
jgi:hypothetical protein